MTFKKISHESYARLQRGTSLLEVMVTLAVIGFGIIGIVYIQGEFSSQSADNKTRAQAVSLIDNEFEILRSNSDVFKQYFSANLPSGVTLELPEQDLVYDESSPDEASQLEKSDPSIKGTNTSFARTTRISDEGVDGIEAVVTVSWIDRSGVSKQIKTTSSLYDPSQDEDAYDKDATGLAAGLVGPQGIALLGEGSISAIEAKYPDDPNAVQLLLPDSDLPNAEADGIDYYRENNTLYLAKGDEIVLTLADICVEGVDCLDNIVTINGRIYIDRNTNDINIGDDIFDVGDIVIKSSDTTYCTKFNFGSTGDDYDYFDYRCFASAGWYGNVGITFRDGVGYEENGHIPCQGDPVSADLQDAPVISTRRVYRGLYEIDTAVDGRPIYQSVGISKGQNIGYLLKTDAEGNLVDSDGVLLTGVNSSEVAYEKDDEGNYILSHNFVIGAQTNLPKGDECSTKYMIYSPDSYNGSDTAGALFAGTQSDFYCLNPHVDQAVLDAYNFEIANLDLYCGGDDPTQNTAFYTISGSLTSNQLVSINTSQGLGNCTIDSDDTALPTGYDCFVYDYTGEDGWYGYIQLDTDLTQAWCDFDRVYQEAYEGGTGPAFQCYEGISAVVRGPITLLKSNTNKPTKIPSMIVSSQLLTFDAENNEVAVLTPDDLPVPVIRTNTCTLDEANLTSFSCTTGDLSVSTDDVQAIPDVYFWKTTLEVATDYTLCNDDGDDGLFPIDNEVEPKVYTQQIIIAENAKDCP